MQFKGGYEEFCHLLYPSVQDPKDIYPVGSKIQYTCTGGYDPLGKLIADCTENLSWKTFSMECKSNQSNCILHFLKKIVVMSGCAKLPTVEVTYFAYLFFCMFIQSLLVTLHPF